MQYLVSGRRKREALARAEFDGYEVDGSIVEAPRAYMQDLKKVYGIGYNPLSAEQADKAGQSFKVTGKRHRLNDFRKALPRGVRYSIERGQLYIIPKTDQHFMMCVDLAKEHNVTIHN